MRENGYTVQAEDVNDLNAIKEQYRVPVELHSCHTAIVNGYVVEGHVPVAEVERLLTERPDVIGIGVAGMPPGSPGMEVEGLDPVPFDVLTFDESGNTAVYASYPQ
jgi:hypothetical protein